MRSRAWSRRSYMSSNDPAACRNWVWCPAASWIVPSWYCWLNIVLFKISQYQACLQEKKSCEILDPMPPPPSHRQAHRICGQVVDDDPAYEGVGTSNKKKFPAKLRQVGSKRTAPLRLKVKVLNQIRNLQILSPRWMNATTYIVVSWRTVNSIERRLPNHTNKEPHGDQGIREISVILSGSKGKMEPGNRMEDDTQRQHIGKSQKNTRCKSHLPGGEW